MGPLTNTPHVPSAYMLITIRLSFHDVLEVDDIRRWLTDHGLCLDAPAGTITRWEDPATHDLVFQQRIPREEKQAVRTQGG